MDEIFNTQYGWAGLAIGVPIVLIGLLTLHGSRIVKVTAMVISVFAGYYIGIYGMHHIDDKLPNEYKPSENVMKYVPYGVATGAGLLAICLVKYIIGGTLGFAGSHTFFLFFPPGNKMASDVQLPITIGCMIGGMVTMCFVGDFIMNFMFIFLGWLLIGVGAGTLFETGLHARVKRLLKLEVVNVDEKILELYLALAGILALTALTIGLRVVMSKK